jgi:hypothetical protein
MDVLDPKQVREHLRESDARIEEERIAITIASGRIRRIPANLIPWERF